MANMSTNVIDAWMEKGNNKYFVVRFSIKKFYFYSGHAIKEQRTGTDQEFIVDLCNFNVIEQNYSEFILIFTSF